MSLVSIYFIIVVLQRNVECPWDLTCRLSEHPTKLNSTELQELIVHLYLCTSQLTHCILPLPSPGVRDCRTTGTSWREIKLFFSFFNVAPFSISSSVVVHTKLVFTLLMCHTFARDTPVVGHLVLWMQMYL